MPTLAEPNDIRELSDLFWETVSADPSYISHGELQMGVASGSGRLAPDGREKWEGYISAKIAGPRSAVLLCRENGRLDGFAVVEISEDGDRPYGTLCDLLVRRGARVHGLGGRLLEAALGWLRDNGAGSVFLESGVENHSAHAYFEKKGFEMVSHVFRLKA